MEESEIVENLQREHEQLLEAQKGLRKALKTYRDRPSRETGGELAASLSEFTAHLTRHFQYEEEGGFLQPLLEHDPSVAPRVRQLSDEHDRMRRDFQELAGGLEDRLAQPDAARRLDAAMLSLLDRLHEHEMAENGLVLDVFWTDSGLID